MALAFSRPRATSHLRLVRSVAIALVLAATPVSALASLVAIAEGDRAWDARAETLVEELATPARIEQAIGHYRAALAAHPDSLEARWKLLRALHYEIDFTNLADDDKTVRVREAVALARTSIERVDADTGDDRREDRARLLFWNAIAWGTRAQRVGLLTIVREGVAGRMHDYAEQSLALDPSVDRGGALRLLSRLHATLPRVPFVSGWVDRKQALPLAMRGHALDPAHPGNRLVLAITLLDQAPERSEEARSLLESVVATAPRPDFLVEDLAIRKQAREQLEAFVGDLR